MNKNEKTYAGYRVHPANIHPWISDVEQESIKLSIQECGQLLPIVLFRDFIVDGKLRAKACEDLGIEVKFKRMPHKSSLEEIKTVVRTSECRTHRPLTAKGLKALDRENKRNREKLEG